MNVTNLKENSISHAQPFTIVNVAQQGVCVGCGACAVVDQNVKLIRNSFGAMIADFSAVPNLADSPADLVCPFSDNSQNEDFLGELIYKDSEHYDERVGYYSSIYSGRRVSEDTLLDSSSGGLTSFVATELLKQGHVDGIIHVGKNQSGENDALFSFVVSYSESEADKHKKSQYYSLSFDAVLKQVRGDGKRYVFVGVPCFIKALRNIALHDEVLAKQISFTLGLVCGHLKSSAFAELLSWQLGVKPEALKAVDFRKKNKSSTVNAYDFMATDHAGNSYSKTSARMFGGGWGYATFQLEACDYCDDIFAETADAVFGDAWLPQFNTYWQGTNIVLVRNKVIDSILNTSKISEKIVLENLSLDDLCLSQQGNFRHRREGLVVRLHDDVNDGKAIPRKRVNLDAIKTIAKKRIALVRLRRSMAHESHVFFYEAKKQGDLNFFINKMTPLKDKMDRFYKPNLIIRAFRKARRILGI
jgi:coenzyme F420 hydrogenase subunit beta